MNDKFTPAFIEMCLDAHEAAGVVRGVLNPEARRVYTVLAYNTLPDALADAQMARLVMLHIAGQRTGGINDPAD